MKQYLFRILLEHVRLEQRRLLRAYNWQQAQFLARDEEKIDKYLREFPRRGESDETGCVIVLARAARLYQRRYARNQSADTLARLLNVEEKLDACLYLFRERNAEASLARERAANGKREQRAGMPVATT